MKLGYILRGPDFWMSGNKRITFITKFLKMDPKTPLLRHIFDMGLLMVPCHISKFSNFSEHSHIGCRWKDNLMLIQNHNKTGYENQYFVLEGSKMIQKWNQNGDKNGKMLNVLIYAVIYHDYLLRSNSA